MIHDVFSDTILRMTNDRSGASSRCCTLRSSPMEWRDFQDENHAQVIEFGDWIGGLAEARQESLLGEIDDLLEAGALGELQESSDWENPIDAIRRHPDIYELRLRHRKKKLRFYHGEPSEYPDLLVKLHRHVKTDKNSQDVAISQAQLRYLGGSAREWQ